MAALYSYIPGVPPLPKIFQEQLAKRSSFHERTAEVQNGHCNSLERAGSSESPPRHSHYKHIFSIQTHSRKKPDVLAQPFKTGNQKLDNSVSELRKEMKSLREMDTDLLNQLMSIYDVISDYKMMLCEQDHHDSDVMSDSMFSMESSIHSLNLTQSDDLMDCVMNTIAQQECGIDFTLKPTTNTMEYDA